MGRENNAQLKARIQALEVENASLRVAATAGAGIPLDMSVEDALAVLGLPVDEIRRVAALPDDGNAGVVHVPTVVRQALQAMAVMVKGSAEEAFSERMDLARSQAADEAQMAERDALRARLSVALHDIPTRVVGARLKLCMAARGWNFEALSAFCGIPAHYVAKATVVERLELADMATWRLIADALEVDLAALAGDHRGSTIERPIMGSDDDARW